MTSLRACVWWAFCTCDALGCAAKPHPRDSFRGSCPQLLLMLRDLPSQSDSADQPEIPRDSVDRGQAADHSRRPSLLEEQARAQVWPADVKTPSCHHCPSGADFFHTNHVSGAQCSAGTRAISMLLCSPAIVACPAPAARAGRSGAWEFVQCCPDQLTARGEPPAWRAAME